jgi:AcrR family transcriptional regulator
VDRRILTAALELFIEGGVGGVSIDATAERAGVTRATVYRRWSTREALLAGALADARTQAEAGLADWTAAPLAELADRLVAILPGILAEPRARALIAHLVGSVPTHPELMATYWEAALATRYEAFEAVIARSVRAGALPSDVDSEVLGDMLAGALLIHLLVRPSPPSAEDIRVYLKRLLRQMRVTELR